VSLFFALEGRDPLCERGLTVGSVSLMNYECCSARMCIATLFPAVHLIELRRVKTSDVYFYFVARQHIKGTSNNG
jgi:hypothetical protein